MISPARSRHATAAALLAVLGSVVLLRAQPPSAPPPVFRAHTGVIPLEVSVLDHHRHPVRGLTAGDFTVLVDGKPMPVATFAEVDLPAPPAASRATSAPAPDAASDIVVSRPPSTTADDGRLVVILFDRSIAPGVPTAMARKIATAAVNQLGPTDEAAVLFMAAGKPQNFTSDRRLLLRAINGGGTGTALSMDAREQWAATFTALGGGDPSADLATVSSQEGSCYCGLCVPEKITHIADTLRDVPRQKSVLFIGDAVTWQDAEPDCVGTLTDATTKMFKALDRSNITIHSLSPSGLEVIGPAARASSSLSATQALRFAPIQTQQAQATEGSLHVLPDYTGGRTVTNTNDPDLYVPEIFAETAAYYVLGVSGDWDTKAPSKIKVTVNRPDISIRARREYVAPPGGPLSAREALAEAVPNFLPPQSIALAASLAPFAVPGKSDPLLLVAMRVHQEFDSGDVPAAPSAADPVRTDRFSLVTTALDEFARPKGTDRHTVQLTFHGTGALEFEALSRLPLKPGHYEIRLGASGSDPSVAGAVSTYVDVPDFGKDPLSLSGVLLAARSDGPTVEPDTLKEVVPVVPTARRTFTRNDAVDAFLRVYEGGSGAIRPTRLATAIHDTSGREVWRQDTALDAAAFDSVRAADARIRLPLDRLAQGVYVMTLRAGDGPNAPSRALRFTIGN